MTIIVELLSSVKDALSARYRSPIWGAAIFSLILCHWKIVLYLTLGAHNAEDSIAFVESNVSVKSVWFSLIYAVIYIIAFPWFELIIDWVAGYGKRRRNEFQMGEKERELGRRKVIAQREQKTLEIQLKNISEQSKISDIELAKHYQNILSGENFSRWLNDLQFGPLNSSVSNTIVNYLHKVDSVEGQFFNSEIENAHRKFVGDLSTLHSAINDARDQSIEDQIKQMRDCGTKAQESQKQYRALVRDLLGI